MSATRPADDPAPDAVATALSAAPFVRVCARADGDALAAAGLLARALRDREVPFQVHVDPDPTRERPAEDTLTVAAGVDSPTADHAIVGGPQPASVAAAAVSRELGVDPDPILGLAGAVAAGATPGADGTDALLADARERELLARRPGVALATTSLADGLAHSTRLWATFSGDDGATREALASIGIPEDADADALESDDHRAIASLAAVETVAAEGAIPGAATALEGALRPHVTPTGPFATVGGYADVLGAVAREAPGTGVALALGHDRAREAALDAWREHARAVHAGLSDASTGRYDGVFVARLDVEDVGRLATAARLLSAYRSPEPVALAIGSGAAATVGGEGRHLGQAMAATAESLRESAATGRDEPPGADGPTEQDTPPEQNKPTENTEPTDTSTVGYGTATLGEARFSTDASTFIAAFREAV